MFMCFQSGRGGDGWSGRVRAHPRAGQEPAGAVQAVAARDAGRRRGRRAWAQGVPAPVQASPMELLARRREPDFRPRRRRR